LEVEEQMQADQHYDQFIRWYQCRGSIFVGKRQRVDCEFECGQSEEGDIIVRLQSVDPAFYHIIIGGLESVVYVSGYTPDGQYMKADIAVAGLPESYAQVLTRINMLAEPQARLKFYKLTFYIVNFEFFRPFKWHLAGYDITVKQVADYNKVKEEMRATKKPKVTAELTVTSPDHRIVNEYEAEHIAHDLCALLSLAKGCQIQWLYWDAFSSDDVLVKSYHWHGVTTPYITSRIILEHPPNMDLDGFVRQTFERYREVNAGGIWKFDQAIGHYVETVSSDSLLELKAISLVVLVDYFTQRYADFAKTTFFVDGTSFNDKRAALRKLISEALESLFSADDLILNEFVPTRKRGAKKRIFNEMADRIDGLNSRSFKSLLNSLLKELDLEVDEDEVETFVEIRNRLVHESYFLTPDDFLERSPYGINPRQFFRVLSLTSRIMLAILQYHGYYYDWGRFEGVEWAGAEKARVKMKYASDK
jgi:hypothetical protein